MFDKKLVIFGLSMTLMQTLFMSEMKSVVQSKVDDPYKFQLEYISGEDEYDDDNDDRVYNAVAEFKSSSLTSSSSTRSYSSSSSIRSYGDDNHGVTRL